MKFTFYVADCVGNAANCSYPNLADISCATQLENAVKNDYVCASYKNNYRSKDNFISSDVIAMDIDNDHTDNPDGWMTEEKLDDLFPDISYALVPSRHHLLPKGNKPAAPRYHIFFPISECTDPVAYANMKEKLYDRYQFFDKNALDAGRFFFGSNSGEAIWHEGWVNIDETLNTVAVINAPGSDMIADDSGLGFVVEDEEDDDPGIPVIPDDIDTIPAGTRNSTMHGYAVRVLKRYGNTDEAKKAYLDLSEKCDPPLDDNELDTIWNSASGYYASTIAVDPNYIPPSDYNSICVFTSQSLIPDDFSDLGEARVLAQMCQNVLKYSTATKYLCFDGKCWQENGPMALGALEAFLDQQLEDAQTEVETAKQLLIKAGLNKKIVDAGIEAIAKACQGNTKLLKILPGAKNALEYQKFVMKYRNNRKMKDVLDVAVPMFSIDVKKLDSDPFLLNTPDGTYDLRKGLNGGRPHDPQDLITKMTSCGPGDMGADIWDDALKLIFCDDQELIDYVQQAVGLAAVGKVFVELMVLAYGEGSNGKSTFWNAIFRVFGSYAGKISPEALTTGCRRNVKPEMAELRGRRLVISSEMEEGMRLNTATVKQLSSTDEIQAEKKYKDPFFFSPYHQLVLYTNHLPKVGANDEGIWRRLAVVPFNAVITGSTDIKNYADYLVENAGPAIMSWIIEGAKKVIDADFHITTPQIVQDAIDEYREENNWLGHFLNECCETDPSYSVKSGELYLAYRADCLQNGEYIRSTTDFYTALEREGYGKRRTNKGSIIIGLRLCGEPDLFTEPEESES